MLGLDLDGQGQTHFLDRLAAPWAVRRQLGLLSAATPAPAESFRFAVLGDAEPGRFWFFRALFNRQGVFPRQLAAIRGQRADFTVQLGDMVSRGIVPHYLRFFRELEQADLSAPYLAVIGNHDRSWPNGRSDSRLYRRLFGKTNYRFDRGGVRFVVVDSSARRLTRRQLRWLDLALAVPGRKVVFTHMPPVQLRLWGGAAAHHLGGFTQGSEGFIEVLSRRRVDRVYMGHVHGFGVQDFSGVRWVLTGGGGSPLFPSGAPELFHHYLTVSVGANGLSERVHALDGTSFAVPRGQVLLSA